VLCYISGRDRAKIAVLIPRIIPVDVETVRVEVANVHQVAIGVTRQAPSIFARYRLCQNNFDDTITYHGCYRFWFIMRTIRLYFKYLYSISSKQYIWGVSPLDFTSFPMVHIITYLFIGNDQFIPQGQTKPLAGVLSIMSS
jgi:hypothetical protein